MAYSRGIDFVRTLFRVIRVGRWDFFLCQSSYEFLLPYFIIVFVLALSRQAEILRTWCGGKCRMRLWFSHSFVINSSTDW